jgi:Ca2+/H+ antiporter
MKMKESNDWLHALEIMGIILIVTPIIVGLPLILYATLTGKNIVMGDSGAGYSVSLMITAGIITIIYVSIKRFKEALKKGEGQESERN